MAFQLNGTLSKHKNEVKIAMTDKKSSIFDVFENKLKYLQSNATLNFSGELGNKEWMAMGVLPNFYIPQHCDIHDYTMFPNTKLQLNLPLKISKIPCNL